MGDQLDMKYERGTDYSQGSVCVSIKIGPHLYPLAFQPEYFPSDGVLYPTGRQVVLFAHPEYGNIQFYLRNVADHWQLDLPEYKDEPVTDGALIGHAYAFELSASLLESIVWSLEHPEELPVLEALPDFSSTSFARSIEIGDSVFPVVFQAEFFPVHSEAIFRSTERMIVLLAHPDHGNITFFLRSVVSPDNLDHVFLLDVPEYHDHFNYDEAAVPAAYPFELSPGIIDLCGDFIESAHM